jgi:hypothetical protein
MAEPVMFNDVVVRKETEAALLVVIDGDDYWIPKSQLHEESEVKGEGDEGQLAITRWIAEQKGLL